MGRTIILNSSNIVSGTNNTRLVYNFPSGGYHFENDEIALQALYQFFSIFNITSNYGNNSFSYIWFDAVEYFVNIPNGYFEITDLNKYFQSVMITNNHYLINTQGDFVYFLEIVINPSLYAVQINSYPLDISTNDTLPVGATWSIPLTPASASFKVNSTAFGELIGFEIGTYNAVSSISTKAPQVTPYSSILVSCNLVNNRAIIPSNILTSFTPLGNTFGSLFKFEPNFVLFSSVDDGQYSQLSVEFRDQLGRDIIIQDPNMLITIYVKKKNE